LPLLFLLTVRESRILLKMPTFKIVTALLPAFLLFSAAPGAATIDSASVTLIASGETHGMLKPCDCPNSPGGGLAERAAAINAVRKSSTPLLFDAGGFSGGGIYDDYTGGRAADSVKTRITIAAMGAMHYDAATPGDDDLQYGAAWLAARAKEAGLPLVSANCMLKSGRLFPPYIVIVKNGIRFAVTGLTTEERLVPRDEWCMILPPVASLRKIWGEMATHADRTVILAHLGEEATLALADSFPEADIIVNGHRKRSQEAAIVHGRTLIMEFGYEGKKLATATVSFPDAHAGGVLQKSGWIEIGPRSGSDPAVAALLADSAAAPKQSIYDLYIMGECPYGCAALQEFVDFVKKFPEVEWNCRFIGTVSGDSLISLHGEGEANDEMAWLAVQALYPEKWLSFLSARSHPPATTPAVAAALGLDTAALGRWVAKNGRVALADQYRRSMRLGISASPTLYVNNLPFTKSILGKRLAREQCADWGEKSARCDSLPECFDDADCRKKGSVGQCLPQGRCAFRTDAPFTFTALIADSSLSHPESTIIATTADLFPKATIRTVRAGSPEGAVMIGRYAPAALPFYRFGSGVREAINFSQIASGIEKQDDGYSFRDGITPKNYFLHRPENPGSIVFFIDPLFPEAVAAMKRVIDDSLLAGRVRFLPVFYADPATAAPSVEESVRREESLRWLVMDSLHRGQAVCYLREYAKNPGSSNWLANLAGTGISADSLYRETARLGTMLERHFLLIDSLGIRDPMALLIDNRSSITIKNETEFTDVLNDLSRKTTRRP
jgi:hypothetical protein